MIIAVIGATGMVGGRVTTEAQRRGHAVVAISRRPIHEVPIAGIRAEAADVADTARMSDLLVDVDVAVSCVRAPQGVEGAIIANTDAALKAAAIAGVRLLVVGGAGPLSSPGDPNRLVLDDPRYVPAAWRAVAADSLAQLRACEWHPEVDWTYLSPPAILRPGLRTGSYRRGTDTLLVDDDGASRISVEDLAVAVIDEVESATAGPRFTVAY